MGIALPQLAPASEDRVSGAQVIDGSSRFNKASKLHLIRTPTSAGNQKTWTLSFWFKKQNMGDQRILFNSFTDNSNRVIVRFMSDKLQFALQTGGTFYGLQTNQVFRDNGWYHVVLVLDTTQNNESSRQRIYVNGDKISDGDLTHNSISGTNKYPTKDATFNTNTTVAHYIGANNESGSVQDTTFDGQISNAYLIDGLAIAPAFFGYTDPLTNVWRPRGKLKKTVNDGTNFTADITNTGSTLNNPARIFDGTIDSDATIASGAATITYTPSTPIKYTDSVRVMGSGSPSNPYNARWQLNGGSNVSTVNANEFVTLDEGNGGGTITSIKLTVDSGGANWRAIQVDGVIMKASSVTSIEFGTNGFYLPMDGNSPIGQDKSGNPNDGTVWSSGWSGTNMSGYNKEESFDGVTNTNGNNATRVEVNQTLTWTNPKTSTPFTTLRLWAADDGSTIRVNGVDVSGQIGAGYAGVQFFTITGVGSALETIELVGGSGVAPFLWAVEIDGTILVDGQYGNSWTPVNFGGSNSIEKATGAKPILNTINGGTTARPGVFGSDVSAVYATTSASNSGGQYYFSHDSSAKPTFSFIRGATYTFDYSASSSHPLRFATAADAAGSTEYTDGTSISGNVIKFTVPHNAPDTLYYYCNVHNGMGNSISVTTDETKADPYAWKNVLAMPLVGNSVDVSNELNCTSITKARSDAGNVHSSSDKSVFYSRSYEFDGSGDYVTPTADADFAFGTGDFTAEAWFNADDIADYRTILDARTSSASSSTGWIIGQRNNKKIYVYSNGFILESTSLPEIGSWNHVAFVRSGSTETLYINGVAEATSTSSRNYSDQNSRIGGEGYSGGGGTYAWNGYISDVRLYKGVAKYTSNFIPAATNPDILPDTPSGVATKSKLKKITDGAVTFDGSGDYLKTTYSSSDFTFGTGDFTIEMFLYNRETGGKGFIQFSDSSGGLKNTSSGVVTIHKDAGQNGVFRAYAKNSSTAFSTPVPYKRWCHVALVRESGTIKLFVDGKQDATTITNDTTDYATTYAAIGGYYDTSYLSNCIISNVRVNKGTALYTSDFIPPTEPLTNVTNTKLLTCQTPTTYQIAAVAPLVSGVNSGTVWSSSITSDSLFRSGFPAAYAFDGTTKSNTNQCAATPQTAGQGFAFTFGEGVPFTTLQMQCDDNNGGYVFVNGVDITSQLPTGSLTNTTITGVTSPLTSIRLISHNGDAAYLGSVTIDGTMLVDPLVPEGNAATSNFNPFDDINTIRGQETGYPTWNPLVASTSTFSDGNLKITTQASGYVNDLVTMRTPAGTGKWYWEFVQTARTGTDYTLVGMLPEDNTYQQGSSNIPQSCGGIGLYIGNNGAPYVASGAATAGTTSATFDVGDVLGWAFDAENGTVKCFKNGVPQGTQFTNVRTDTGWTFCVTDYDNTTVSTFEINFGQKPFKFSPPDGYQSLNFSTLRPDTVITRPDKFVSAITYTGNGASSPGGSGGTQSIDVKHKPDLIWIKDRTQTHNHNLVDSIRGPGSILMSDSDVVPVTNSTDAVTAFTDTGFTLGDNGEGTQSLELNKNGNNYVVWSWRAGGNAGTFNIDDVDMGSAANAKMSAGSLNNDAYDQSQRWRDNITSSNGWNTSYPVANIFNGSFDGGGGAANNGSGGVVTFTPPAAITVTKLELSCYNPVTLTLPDGTTREVAGVGSANKDVTVDIGSGFSFTGSNSITISRTGGFIYLERIKINGKELVDDDITPANAPSIPATACSVGTKQGFSIIKYAGSGSNSTFPHGLTQAPDFYIVKCLDVSNENWRVYHSSVGATKALTLNSGSEPSASNLYWNNTEPTSTVASVYAGYDGVNNTGRNYIAYCWHDVPGLQKFGSYVANGSADGPFVEVGFRPAVVWCKVIQTGVSDNWAIQDTARAQFNTYDSTIRLNDNAAEVVNSGNYYFDFTSNGFKIKNTNGEYNGTSGWQYIYCAWAEAPVSNLYGAQSNAF